MMIDLLLSNIDMHPSSASFPNEINDTLLRLGNILAFLASWERLVDSGKNPDFVEVMAVVSGNLRQGQCHLVS